MQDGCSICSMIIDEIIDKVSDYKTYFEAIKTNCKGLILPLF